MNIETTPELARTQALILAGGQGERMRPLTLSKPRPAVAFGGMFRIIDFTLSNCFYSGVRHLSLLTQHKHEELHRYVRQGWSDLWASDQVDREFLRLLPPASGKCYRGPADAVFQNREMFESGNSEYVLILSGNHVYHMDYRDLLRRHAEKDADVTIATVERPLCEASEFGVVEVDGDSRVVGFDDTPSTPCPLVPRSSMGLVSMGVYVFKKTILLESLREPCESGVGLDFGRDVIPALVGSGRTYAYDFRDEARDSPRYWRNIGTIDSYYRANMDLVADDPLFDPYANDVCPSQPTRHPAIKGRAVREYPVSRTVVSPGASLEEGATVEDCVLLPGVRIGKGARLRRTIVEEGVHIPAGFQSGFDLQEDRRHHTVTDAGIVVLGRNPVDREKTFPAFPRQRKERRNAIPLGA